MKIKLLSAAVAATMALSVATVPAFAATVSTSGQSTTVPMSLAATAATFSVTVPTNLPIAVSASGGGSATGDSPTITNKSAAPVVIDSVKVTSQNGWSLVNYDTMQNNFDTMKIDSTDIGLRVNEQAVDDGQNISAATFYSTDFIGMDETITFDYDAIVTAQSSAYTKEVAKVVFVFDWYATVD